MDIFYRIYTVIKYISAYNIAEIALLSVVVYYCIKYVRGTRIEAILKCTITIAVVYLLAYAFGMDVIVEIFQRAAFFLGISVVVAVQPEIRRIVEGLGSKRLNFSFKSIVNSITNKGESKQYALPEVAVTSLTKGCFKMGKALTGALIVIEGKSPLTQFINSGIKLDANISSELLINIFEKNTPLHDGAVIIKGDTVLAATCYLPLTESIVDKELGTRHRAAIGLSEITDALVIVVSEETGAVSISIDGKLYRNLSREKFVELLNNFQAADEFKQANNTKSKVIKLVSSVAFSIITWTVVTIAINPVVSTTYDDIPIKYLNRQSIEDAGYTINTSDNSTAKVTVYGTRDELDAVSEDDISVIADLSLLSQYNTVELVPSVRYSDVECKVSKDVIHVDIEKIISAELDISVEFTGDSDSKHFISGAELDSSIVTVSGAQSIINTAGKAVVYIDRSTITKSETLDCKIEVFDRNGTNITKDIKLSQDAVDVNVSVYNTKTIGVDLKLTCADKELEEYISGITLDKENIVIAGPDKELKNIDSLSIDSEIVVSASDIMSGVMLKTVSVSQYLPSTVVAVSGFETLTATVKFVETESVTVDIEYSSIDIHGKAKIEPLQSSVSFSVIAKAGEMPSNVEENLEVSFDTSGLSVGAQEVKLTTVCDGVRLLNNATLYLNIIQEG